MPRCPGSGATQGPHKLQIAGLAVGADHHEVFSGGDGKLTVLCFRRDELIGVETVNAPGRPHGGPQAVVFRPARDARRCPRRRLQRGGPVQVAQG